MDFWWIILFFLCVALVMGLNPSLKREPAIYYDPPAEDEEYL